MLYVQILESGEKELDGLRWTVHYQRFQSQLELPVACLMAGHGDMASEDHLSVILEKA